MPDSDFRLTGGCGCGAVRFKLTAPPTAAGYCHCTRCQHRTGGGMVAAGARRAGARSRSRRAPAPSGSWRPEGGFAKGVLRALRLVPVEPVAGRSRARVGALRGLRRRPQIRPTYRAFVDFAAPFEPIPDDGLARYGGGRPSASPLDGSRWRGAWSEPAAAATLHFDGWRLSGHSGVNQYAGGYETPPGTIVVGPVMATRMAGPEPAMAVERELFELLAGSRPYARSEGELRIGAGAAARRFVPAGPGARRSNPSRASPGGRTRRTAPARTS